MIKALKTLLNIGLVLFFIVIFSSEARAEVGVPKIIKLTAQNSLSLAGTTSAESEILVYLDGNFVGRTESFVNCSGPVVKESECQIGWNFQSDLTKKLADGAHAVAVVAQDKISLVLSAPTKEIKFTINVLPAPTILKPVVNRETSSNRPFIVGLAKNDSKIKIYIDKKYNGELTVKNHLSGTANFAYKPRTALARGEHAVYTIAIDKQGKQSLWSNTVNFFTQNAAIAESAQEGSKEAAANAETPNQPVEIKSEPAVISSNLDAVLKTNETEPTAQIKTPAPTGQKLDPAQIDLKAKEQVIKQELQDRENAALEKVKNLIGTNTSSPKSDRGMVNEGRQNQGRLKLSIILFILFLVGVVAWLLWVNRELVKERRAQTEAKELSDAEALAAKKAEENKNNPSGGQDNKLF